MSAQEAEPTPTSPELGSLASSQEDNLEEGIEEAIARGKDDSTSSLNVAHLSEADRGALYASLMPPSIQQPADIVKVPHKH